MLLVHVHAGVCHRKIHDAGFTACRDNIFFLRNISKKHQWMLILSIMKLLHHTHQTCFTALVLPI